MQSVYSIAPTDWAIYLFIIITNSTIVKSTVMHFHLVYYTFILTFPLEGAIDFISTINFKG